ncbi:MAG TPA: hypothetical protein DHV59_16950, partial [Oxalobacteraceae bacterium]|nr:hypothetical protein [Oxalobacteraceae bacterium]
STAFTRQGSQVQTLHRPPTITAVTSLLPHSIGSRISLLMQAFFILSCRAVLVSNLWAAAFPIMIEY